MDLKFSKWQHFRNPNLPERPFSQIFHGAFGAATDIGLSFTFIAFLAHFSEMVAFQRPKKRRMVVGLHLGDHPQSRALVELQKCLYFWDGEGWSFDCKFLSKGVGLQILERCQYFADFFATETIRQG